MLVLSDFISIFSLNKFSSLRSVRFVLEPIDPSGQGLSLVSDARRD